MVNSIPSKNESTVQFSIITVVYNGESLLAGTLESVFRQTWQNVEYIVVDGASKARSVEIIREYAAKMPGLKWISEPDKGLYDAMNKGLRLATGDFIQFLNAGDWLHAPDTLAKLAAIISAETDVLYGDTLLVDESRTPHGLMSEMSTRSLPKPLHWRDYLTGMRVVHQSFIPRRTLAPEYRLETGLCADYDWCIEILKKSRKNICLDEPVTDYLMGGLSKKRHRQSLQERFSIMQQHFGLVPAILAHVWIVLRAGLHRIKRWNKERY